MKQMCVLIGSVIFDRHTEREREPDDVNLKTNIAVGPAPHQGAAPRRCADV